MELFGNLKITRLADLAVIEKAPENIDIVEIEGPINVTASPMVTPETVQPASAQPDPSQSSNNVIEIMPKKRGKRSTKKKGDEFFSEDELLYMNSTGSSEEEDLPSGEYKKRGAPAAKDDEVALFDGVNGVDEVLYGEVEYQEDPENLHPAEVAARYQSTQKGPLEVTDGQILKDLRKLVFSVPLLHQEEVSKYFNQIDQCVFPTVYSILDTSMVYFEEVVQVVIKVAAGNTYGKNIYEKGNPDDETEMSKRTDLRGTYKPHEIRFLKNSYNLFRLFAHKTTQDNNPEYKGTLPVTIKKAMTESAFIRGVYEDIISDFVNYTKHYDELHWLALDAKIRQDHDEYHRLTDIMILIDRKLKLNKSAYYMTREARRIYQKYMELRASIITPYLRSVYSTAKKTARNPHQMLDNFQNGSIGLMRAVSCYSVKRLASFASVAKWWIKQMMLLSIKEDANFVKLPVSTWQAYTQLEKARNKVGAAEPDLEAIAKEAKMPLKKVKAVYYTVKISQVYSLNRTYDAEEKLTLEDIMTNEDRLGGEIDPFISLLRDYCVDSNLTEKELKIMALRHGMVDLIENKETTTEDRLHETMIQNLATLGYNYKYAT